MTRKPRLVVASVLALGALSGGIAMAAGGGETCIKPENGQGCLPVAPDGERVDLATPTFSNPTKVTNPLHPTSQVGSVVLLGRVDQLPFRTEVTLLPGTKTIEWKGQKVETLVSQYVAFLDGRLHEVALDWYAQADDGSVWYLGEDVFNYNRKGAVADTHGTWLAGREGPAAMIMPANPQVGDVYRPENSPGVVFEEVTVKAVGQTVHGPRGPLTGAIVVEELHMDGTFEDKIFAPGYGEFLTGRGGTLEAAALAVPTDTLPGPPPAELATLTTGAASIVAAAQQNDWRAASATLDSVLAAWNRYRAGDVPRLLDADMSAALVFLVAAVDARQPLDASDAAIDVGRVALDFELRHRPVAEIDLARFELWVRQALVDVASRKPGAVTGDVATLEWVWDRVAHTVDRSAAGRIDTELGKLRTAADSENLVGARNAATQLQGIVAGLRPAR